MTNKIKLILLDLFNEIYRTSQFPDEWINHYIHFISKNSSGDVRPITLTPCLCKLFGTLLKNRLDFWCEKNDILPKTQNGFRKGKSCNDNLVRLLLFIDMNKINDCDTLATFIDISQAFDNIILDILVEKLSKIGCSLRFIKFTKFITHERNVVANDHDTIRKIYKGVPQGGLLYCIPYT